MVHTARDKAKLLASTRAAIAGLMSEVVEDHLVDTDKHPDALDTAAVEQLLAVIRIYLK